MEIPGFIMMVLKRLHSSGHQGYVVGGAVRDYYSRRKRIDWDVATSAGLDEIKSLFADVRHFFLRHDTVTLVFSDLHCEITVFKGGKVCGKTLEEDLAHRDFTINAMAYDVARGAIIDPHGGKKDLSRRVIRSVGDPYDRFLEDPVRLLRAVRLATEFVYEIEPRTQQAISAMVERLSSVAEERVRDELLKILMSGKPSRGFNLMRKTGLLDHVIPELLEGYRKKQGSPHRFTIYKHLMETVDHVDPDPVLRLTALFHDIGKPRVRRKMKGVFRFFEHEKVSADMSREIMTRLKFSKKMMSRVVKLVTLHMAAVGYHEGWRDNALRRLIRRVGSEDMDHFLLFCRADILAHGQNDGTMAAFSVFKERLEAVRKRPIAVKKRDLALDGRRVMDVLDLPQGPEVGKILDQLLETVIDHPEWNTEDRLEALLKEMKKDAQVSAVKSEPHG
jgi:poly(A) polymerase/tRNA nucleotidyltransferase (CCA-adding enzyme)